VLGPANEDVFDLDRRLRIDLHCRNALMAAGVTFLLEFAELAPRSSLYRRSVLPAGMVSVVG
jgi:hypothetical protein